jgi:predicted nucleic acid-binding protein
VIATFTALYDACVLYPAALRSLLMYLALSGLYRARWTEQIHDEWTRNLLQNKPTLSEASLAETRRLMNLHVEGALISDYENLIESLSLPDPNDRHVLAAAIRGRVDVIVTYNTNDFPRDIIEPLGMEVQHPDEFITHLFDLEPESVLAAVRRQRSKLTRPPISAEAFLEHLEQLQLPRTVYLLRPYLKML